MMRTRLTIIAALAMALVATACAGGDGVPDGTADREPVTSGTPGATAPATTSPPTSAPGPPTTAPGRTSPPGPTAPSQTPPGITVKASGTIVAGVEPGCVLLQTADGEPYLLLGEEVSALRPGSRVEVTGVLLDNVMSICQQGRPLEVISVTSR